MVKKVGRYIIYSTIVGQEPIRPKKKNTYVRDG